MVFDGDAQHLGGDDAGKRLGEVRDHVHSAAGDHRIQQSLRDLPDVGAQDLHARRREGVGGETPEPRVGRGVQDANDVRVPGDDPDMEEGIPVDGVLRSQPVVERIWIGQDPGSRSR